MKKNKELLKFILIVVLSVASYLGLLLLFSPKGWNILWFILLQIIGLPLSLFLFVFFHEFGHFIFGKMSGYEFVSFKVGPLEWKQVDGKIKFSIIPQNFFVLGQCLMAPPKPKKKTYPKFYLYNAGGLIFSYLQCVISILIVIIVPSLYIKWLVLPTVLVGMFLTINNSMYSPNGVNDVCNHINVKKNPKYIYSVMYQLEMIANISKGKRYGAKCYYEGYYEEKLNHITIPVVQFKFFQAIEHNKFDEAKELSKVMKNNYSRMVFWVQKIGFYFDILYSDIVLSMNMRAFKRDFNRANTKIKEFCQKEGSDAYYYYKIYQRIYNNEYFVRDIVDELLKQETLFIGERLSLEKKFNLLIEKLDFYVENNYSFEVRDLNEVF